MYVLLCAGLTTLGASDPMHEGTKLSQAYGFHEIPYEAYVEVFNQNVIGDSDVSVRPRPGGEGGQHQGGGGQRGAR